MVNLDLIEKVKENLIIDNREDDHLIGELAAAAVAYAEGYQHRPAGYYSANEMSKTTEQGVIMLASHWFLSRDGGTGGFFSDSVSAANRSMLAAQELLRMDREWQV